jgi:hypothetical protein
MSDISMENQEAFPFPSPSPSMEQIEQIIATRIAAVIQQGGGQPMVQQHNNGIGNGARPSKPTRYDGSLTSDPTVWLFQFKQYADIANVSATQRVKLAATYLDGNASTWWMQLVSEQPNNNADPITWQIFYDRMMAAFKPINNKKIARNKIAVLKQTHSVQRYNNEFRSLCREIDDMTGAEQLDRYVRGLKDDIRTRVELQRPTTLNDAMSSAHTIDSISYHARVSYNHNNSNYYNYTPTTHNHNPDAMDLSAITVEGDNTNDDDTLNAVNSRENNQRGGSTYNTNSTSRNNRGFTPLQRLSQEEFSYCQRNRLCLRCKEGGHIARNCTKPVKPLNSRAR